MENKNNNSVIKLIGNKLFIFLLLFAIAVIVFSSILNSRMSRLTKTPSSDTKADVPVLSQTENVKSEAEKIEATQPKSVAVSKKQVEQKTEVADTKVKYSMPANGDIIKEYSNNELVWNETMEDWRTHNGTDISVSANTEIDTVARGVVLKSEKDGIYGYTVVVEHPDGNRSVYKNLSKTVVEKDDILDEGQMIGVVEKNAEFEQAQDLHIHIEIITSEGYTNPIDFINKK